MGAVLILQNVAREGPGILEAVLAKRKYHHVLVNLDKNQIIPDLDVYDAVIVLGGPDSANDDSAKMINELLYVKRALADGIPYLGICLGMQILIKAAGGSVVKAHVKEVGLIDSDGQQSTVELTKIGQNDPLLAGLSSSFDVFHLHGETVELTDSMRLLATGKYCPNQIVRVAPKMYGIQSHFELTPRMLRIWAQQDPDLLPLGEKVLLDQFTSMAETYRSVGETLFNNFLDIVDR